MRPDRQSPTAVTVSCNLKNMARQDSYQQLLAQMETLTSSSAESTLANLAAAIFPNGFGTLHQVSWEGNGAGHIDPPLALGAGATADQRTSDKLRAAELRYRTLIEQIPAVTFMAVLGEGQNEIYVSPHIEALLGFTQKEWLENPFLWFTQLYSDVNRCSTTSSHAAAEPADRSAPSAVSSRATAASCGSVAKRD